MVTDWTKLAHQLGSIKKDGSKTVNENLTKKAFDYILGDEWIENTVEHIISFKGGRELAMSCLQYLHSNKATFYAYSVYKASGGEKAEQAVWLIKQLANPVSFDWIEGFLNDHNVMHWGLGVLDQLLWTEQIPFDEKAKTLLILADEKSDGTLKQQIDFIRQYCEEKSNKNV